MTDQPDNIEIGLTLDDIVQGEKFTRKLVLISDNPNYNKRTINYKVPTPQELAQAMRDSDFDREDSASSIEFSLKLIEMCTIPESVGKQFGRVRDPNIIKQVSDAIMGASKAVNSPDESKS